MNKTELSKVFKTLGNEKNMELLLQIPCSTPELKTELSVMPLHRRLKQMRDAGLIDITTAKKN